MNRFIISVVLALGLVYRCPASNLPVYLETNRTHSATGEFGGTVTAATNASPIVITTAAAHNFASTDQVQVTGIGGNTNANTLAYVNVLTSTTFALYSDVNLSVPIAGNASYTSGGKVSEAADISQFVTGSDFTAYITITGASGGRSMPCLQDSTDGFVNDILTVACADVSGPVNEGTEIKYSFRAYQLPSLRAGVLNARIRVAIISQDGGASVTVTAALR
jgi:hypothetical protein